MTKTPIQTKIRKPMDNTKTPQKLRLRVTIADPLRTVSWSNNSHPTGVVKPDLKNTKLSTHRKSSVINRTRQNRNIVYYIFTSAQYFPYWMCWKPDCINERMIASLCKSAQRHLYRSAERVWSFRCQWLERLSPCPFQK